VKAIVRETYGPPDVLRLGDVPTPTTGDEGVLVRVHAASANAGDWHLLRGTPLPFRLVAGLIKPKYKIGSAQESDNLPERPAFSENWPWLT
jgi:NADPH:quinone reductase-like Zn-dependent oxidoreductase